MAKPNIEKWQNLILKNDKTGYRKLTQPDIANEQNRILKMSKTGY